MKLNDKDVSFSLQEEENLRSVLETCEGRPILCQRGIREVWYRDDAWEMELRLLFLHDIRLTVSRVCFVNRRQGTMTKVLAFLKEFCERNHIKELVIQSVETLEMANWCLKMGFEPDPHASFALPDNEFVLGDYKMQ